MTTTVQQHSSQTTTETVSTTCLSAVFQTQEQVDTAIRRLLHRGISRDDISVIGKNFQSETRITGFLTKRDVILATRREAPRSTEGECRDDSRAC
jgi:hypothetical protein